MKVIIRNGSGQALAVDTEMSITIETDSGTQYDVKEVQPDTLQVKIAGENQFIKIVPVDMNTIELL